MLSLRGEQFILVGGILVVKKKISTGVSEYSGIQQDFTRVGLSGDVEFFLDPPGNTGSDSHSGGACIKIDWLTLCWEGKPLLPQGDRQPWELLLDRHLNILIDFSNSNPITRGIRWDRAYKGNFGADYYERMCPDGLPAYRISIPGKALGAYQASDVARFLKAFVVAYPTARSTRIDIALDDFSKSLSPLCMISSIEAGENKGFREATLIAGIGQGLGLRDGWTLGLGSRQSDKYYRYYNKEAESKGLISSWRLELEAKGDYAKYIFEILLKHEDSKTLERELLDIVVGGIDFRLGKSKNLNRTERSLFWEEWIAKMKATPLRMHISRTKSTIIKKLAWIAKQVAGAAYLGMRALGLDEFEEMVRNVANDSTQSRRKDTEFLLDEYARLCMIE